MGKKIRVPSCQKVEREVKRKEGKKGRKREKKEAKTEIEK